MNTWRSIADLDSKNMFPQYRSIVIDYIPKVIESKAYITFYIYHGL